MSHVVRVPDELYEQIQLMKLTKKKKKNGRPKKLNIWTTPMKDWQIRLIYEPKKV